MTEQETKEKLLPALEQVNAAIVKLIPQLIEQEKINSCLYEYYGAAIFYEQGRIGSFKEGTPELVKALLTIGFELAKKEAGF